MVNGSVLHQKAPPGGVTLSWGLLVQPRGQGGIARLRDDRADDESEQVGKFVGEAGALLLDAHSQPGGMRQEVLRPTVGRHDVDAADTADLVHLLDARRGADLTIEAVISIPHVTPDILANMRNVAEKAAVVQDSPGDGPNVAREALLLANHIREVVESRTVRGSVVQELFHGFLLSLALVPMLTYAAHFFFLNELEKV